MDKDAVAALYRTHASAVLRRARQLLGNEAAARDAVQEVFLKALTSGDAFRGEASPTTWFYRLVTNHCLKAMQMGARRGALLALVPEQPPAGHEATEARLVLLRVLPKVAEELRDIAVYYFVDQMNQDEIGELLGMPRRTVSYRLEQFKQQARAAGVEVEYSGASDAEASASQR